MATARGTELMKKRQSKLFQASHANEIILGYMSHYIFIYIYIYIRGVMVHKIHGSIRYDTVVSRFGTFLKQQKERNAREISLIFTFVLFIKTNFSL